METFSELNIKGMVCNRCVLTINDVLRSEGFAIAGVTLGKVLFEQPINLIQREKIAELLSVLGFQLLSNKNEEFLTKLKLSIEDYVEALEEDGKRTKLSDYLSQEFSKSYDLISEFFSKYEGITIEKYFINLRIEKVKKMLLCTSFTLSEIAFKTGFNTAHHLSAQFKKNTGLNPSKLRTIDQEFRKDKI